MAQPNVDSLFQQRLAERGTPQPQQQQPQQQPQPASVGNPVLSLDLRTLPQPNVAPSGINPDPTQLLQFAQMDPGSMQRYASGNPQAYSDAWNAVLLQQQQYAASQAQQQPPPPSSHSASTEPSSPSHAVQTTVNDYDSSELSNNHSSDDELNQPAENDQRMGEYRRKTLTGPTVHAVRRTPAIRTASAGANKTYLPIDFRLDLIDVTPKLEYVVRFPKRHNVRTIKLDRFIVNATAALLDEPYIFIRIKELEGSYQLSSNVRGPTTVFGKLVQDRTVNGFIHYKAEHCSRTFAEPQRLTTLSISFLSYDLSPISLTRLAVADVRKSAKFLKVVSPEEHHLRPRDSVCVTTTRNTDGTTTAERLRVVDIPASNAFIVDRPTAAFDNAGISFDTLNVKCSMTFKLR